MKQSIVLSLGRNAVKAASPLDSYIDPAYNAVCKYCHRSPAKCGVFAFMESGMINTIIHAKAVQARRKAAGRNGIAGAVKRYLKRTGKPATVLK